MFQVLQTLHCGPKNSKQGIFVLKLESQILLFCLIVSFLLILANYLMFHKVKDTIHMSTVHNKQQP